MREPFFLCLSQHARYGGFPCVNGDVIDEDVGSLVLDVLDVAYAFSAGHATEIRAFIAHAIEDRARSLQQG